MLRLIIQISLIAGPIALLVLFQLQFLPYHSEWITNWQRFAVVIGLILLWMLWPQIARSRTACIRWSDLKRIQAWGWVPVSILPILLVFTIATFPGEWLEGNLPPLPLIPMEAKAQRPDAKWATLHELLLAGEVNYVTGEPQSLFSNVLVLPNFEADNRKLSLRGRSLEGAVLAFAHLRNADFTGASLARANFGGADLREAKFDCEKTAGGIPGFFPIGLVGKDTKCTQLQSADFALARLQGASFRGAQMQGDIFFYAQLQGVNLGNAQLQGSDLVGVPLQGASLNGTQLQGAELFAARLQGAELFFAQLQGAFLYDAQLQGALLFQDLVWRTYPPSNTEGAFVIRPEPAPKYSGLNCNTSRCDWSETSYATLKSLIYNIDYPLESERARALHQIAVLGKPPFITDEASAKAWKDLEKESARLDGSYFDTLAKTLKATGCAAEGAP